MYLKLKNKIIEKYPYSVYDLKADNPNTSFPLEMPNERLLEWDMHPVLSTEPPIISEGQELVEGTPTFNGVNWIQTWEIK
jgi:hypothetical protein